MATNTPQSILSNQPSSATAQPTPAQPQDKAVLQLMQELLSIWEFSNDLLASLPPFTGLKPLMTSQLFQKSSEAAKDALPELSARFNDFHTRYNMTKRTLEGYYQELMVVMMDLVTRQVCQDWRVAPGLQELMVLPGSGEEDAGVVGILAGSSTHLLSQF